MPGYRNQPFSVPTFGDPAPNTGGAGYIPRPLPTAAPLPVAKPAIPAATPPTALARPPQSSPQNPYVQQTAAGLITPGSLMFSPNIQNPQQAMQTATSLESNPITAGNRRDLAEMQRRSGLVDQAQLNPGSVVFQGGQGYNVPDQRPTPTSVYNAGSSAGALIGRQESSQAQDERGRMLVDANRQGWRPEMEAILRDRSLGDPATRQRLALQNTPDAIARQTQQTQAWGQAQSAAAPFMLAEGDRAANLGLGEQRFSDARRTDAMTPADLEFRRSQTRDADAFRPGKVEGQRQQNIGQQLQNESIGQPSVPGQILAPGVGRAPSALDPDQEKSRLEMDKLRAQIDATKTRTDNSTLSDADKLSIRMIQKEKADLQERRIMFEGAGKDEADAQAALKQIDDRLADIDMELTGFGVGRSGGAGFSSNTASGPGLSGSDLATTSGAPSTLTAPQKTSATSFVNPKTGERITWNGSAWVPAS